MFMALFPLTYRYLELSHLFLHVLFKSLFLIPLLTFTPAPHSHTHTQESNEDQDLSLAVSLLWGTFFLVPFNGREVSDL